MTTRTKQRVFMLTLLLAGLAGSFLPDRISVTLTPSVKHRVWWLSGDTSQVRHGEYVLFHLPYDRMQGMPVPDAVADDKGIRAIKRVGCDEGEDLRRVDRDFFCGDEFLGRAKERSQKGQPLTLASFSGMVPPGQVFLVGDHPDSFDSRYFGLVKKVNYLAWARPVF